MMPLLRRPGGELATRPLHFIWITDCSGSMKSHGKIQALNTAIREATPHMQKVADENPNAEVLVRALKFSTIKVDRSFVQGAAQGSRESLAIIRAVVAMAQSLEMTTTAEGAETIEEVQLIRKLGCDKIQGYYFGRPMEPADAFKLTTRAARAAAAA